MSDWLAEKINLGKTDLMVGRLGLGAAYGAPAKSYEAAFDAGCNYFYWGALRGKKMAEAIWNIVSKGKRDELILVIQDFRRSPKGLEKSLMRGLKKAGVNAAEVLLLGWHNKPPKPKVLDAAERLREQGLFRYLGLSSHKRSLFPELARDPRYDIFHIRYNAANRGAEEDLFPHLPDERPGNVIFQATRRMSLAKSNKIPADEKRPTAGDCYRFALSNPFVDVVITGPSNARQLEENLAELEKGPMIEEELGWMRRIGDYVYGRKSK
ncbi:MAG: aldo/keto reductase [Candidatus Aminicenantes bacterium]|jgi:aryl-alcohol dehydrogenase-like predicted oxidoreductase